MMLIIPDQSFNGNPDGSCAASPLELTVATRRLLQVVCSQKYAESFSRRSFLRYSRDRGIDAGFVTITDWSTYLPMSRYLYASKLKLVTYPATKMIQSPA
jgi:hypothetical protein